MFLVSACSMMDRSTEPQSASDVPPNPVVDKSRLVLVDVDLKDMVEDKSTKEKVCVLDTYQNSILNIIKELRAENFPIYEIACYSNRNIRGSNTLSLHAYASAIDLNEYQNPSFDAVLDCKVPTISNKEWQNLKFVEKTDENEDFFINREVKRPGMTTEKEAQIFAKYGFTIWGGKWRRPMDFMHFQTTKAIAKIVVGLSSKEAEVFWTEYLKDPMAIAKDPFFARDIDQKDIKLDLLLEKMKDIRSCQTKHY